LVQYEAKKEVLHFTAYSPKKKVTTAVVAPEVIPIGATFPDGAGGLM